MFWLTLFFMIIFAACMFWLGMLFYEYRCVENPRRKPITLGFKKIKQTLKNEPVVHLSSNIVGIPVCFYWTEGEETNPVLTTNSELVTCVHCRTSDKIQRWSKE